MDIITKYNSIISRVSVSSKMILVAMLSRHPFVGSTGKALRAPWKAFADQIPNAGILAAAQSVFADVECDQANVNTGVKLVAADLVINFVGFTSTLNFGVLISLKPAPNVTCVGPSQVRYQPWPLAPQQAILLDDTKDGEVTFLLLPSFLNGSTVNVRIGGLPTLTFPDGQIADGTRVSVTLLDSAFSDFCCLFRDKEIVDLFEDFRLERFRLS